MDKDTQRELERLERELLDDPRELTEEELLSDLDLDGVFQEISEAPKLDDRKFYSHYQHDYSDELQSFANQKKKPHFAGKLALFLAVCLGLFLIALYFLGVLP